MTIGEEMEIGHFYYIDDQYFKDFPDSYLMQNKEKVNEKPNPPAMLG